jgi:shikimate dehydrogenase
MTTPEFHDKSIRFAVLGNPIGHSLSPLIHQSFAKQTDISLTYERIEVNIDFFSAALETLIKQGYQGFNITLPFKEEAYEWCLKNGSLDNKATLARAINTLQIQHNRAATGFNTDGSGLVADLKRLNINVNQKRILVIGAGGAARGIIPALKEAGALLTITNRTFERAKLLGNWFDIPIVSLEELQAHQTHTPYRFDVILNSTSAEMNLNSLDLPESLFNNTELVYDLMYRKDRALTVFLQHAKDSGASNVSDGLGMLIEQAAEAFFIWHGIRPQTSSTLEEINQHLFETALDR